MTSLDDIGEIIRFEIERSALDDVSKKELRHSTLNPYPPLSFKNDLG